MRRALLDEIRLTSTSGTICVELVRKLELSGCEVKEIGVRHYPRLHGRSQFFRVRSLAKTFFQLARFGAVVLSVVLSLFIGFVAQASSPDYRRLFLSILPIAAVDVALIVFVCTTKERKKIWLIAVPALLGFASYLEMACRVLFGVRLL